MPGNWQNITRRHPVQLEYKEPSAVLICSAVKATQYIPFGVRRILVTLIAFWGVVHEVLAWVLVLTEGCYSLPSLKFSVTTCGVLLTFERECKYRLQQIQPFIG